MNKSWLVVADSARARVFDVDLRAGTIAEHAAMIHTDSRMPGSELDADRPGRSFDSVGDGRHALAGSASPHEREANAFARQVAEHLKRGQLSGAYRYLRLAAPPAFLGILRKHLDDNVRQSVQKTVSKNLVHEPPEVIAAQFFDRKKLTDGDKHANA